MAGSFHTRARIELPVLGPFCALVENPQHLDFILVNPIRSNERMVGKDQISYIRNLRWAPTSWKELQPFKSLKHPHDGIGSTLRAYLRLVVFMNRV